MESGEQEAQAGKGIISVSHIKIKERTAIQTVYVPCQLCSSPPTRVTVGFFFFIEAKEYFSHAVAPLTSYKWSKWHMKIVLCKISTSLFRYTLGQGNAVIPCSKLSSVLNYPTSMSCVSFFRVHQSHIFKFYSAAELGTMKQCTFRNPGPNEAIKQCNIYSTTTGTANTGITGSYFSAE